MDVEFSSHQEAHHGCESGVFLQDWWGLFLYDKCTEIRSMASLSTRYHNKSNRLKHLHIESMRDLTTFFKNFS